MRLLLLVGALCSYAHASAFSYGHAAYVYPPMKCASDPCTPTPSCNEASFAPDIAAFNKAAKHEDGRISKILTYGGDVEFWGTKSDPIACWAPANTNCNMSVFFDPQNEKAAETYSNAFGVKNVVALVDGRMDGIEMIDTYNGYDPCNYGDFYPALQNASDVQLIDVADRMAALYCMSDTIDGVQVDLEPFKDPYTLSASKFVAAASASLRDLTNNCRNSKHPDGRSVSYFTFAHSQSHIFTADILGPNGYYVFSLYDLDPNPADGGFMYNTVQEFKDKLTYELSFLPAVVEHDGHFTLAIPVAASCHEYEEYQPMSGEGCGPACIAEKNTAEMHEYVQAAFDVLLDPETTKKYGGLFCMNETAGTQFLGMSFWVWTSEMTYPPEKWFSNNFLPVTPTKKVLEVLQDNLYKLSDGTTCVDKSKCTASSDRPNGCPCTHSYECESNWCDGTCATPPEEWLHAPPPAWTRQYGDYMKQPGTFEVLSGDM